MQNSISWWHWILWLLTCKRSANLFQCIVKELICMHKGVLFWELLCLCSVDFPIEPVRVSLYSFLSLNSQNITFTLCLYQEGKPWMLLKVAETMGAKFVISLSSSYCIVANIIDTLSCTLHAAFLFLPHFNAIWDP